MPKLDDNIEGTGVMGRVKGRDTRQALLDAAAAVISEQGGIHASTRVIARRAGMSEATIYLHFAGKNELLAALIQERLRLPVLTMRIGMPDAKQDPHSVLAGILRSVLQRVDEDLPLLAAVFEDAELAALVRADPPGEGSFEGLERLAAYFAHLQATGRIGTQTDALILARLLLGAAFHQAFLRALFGERRLQPHGRAFIDAIVQGVLAAAGPAAGPTPRRRSPRTS